MDKDVEVSKDQNTIAVDGNTYKAVVSYVVDCCGSCHVPLHSGRQFCSLIPCYAAERKDGNRIFLTPI